MMEIKKQKRQSRVKHLLKIKNVQLNCVVIQI